MHKMFCFSLWISPGCTMLLVFYSCATNNHKLNLNGRLKQHLFIITQLWRSKVQAGSNGSSSWDLFKAKIKVLHPSSRGLKENCISSPSGVMQNSLWLWDWSPCFLPPVSWGPLSQLIETALKSLYAAHFIFKPSNSASKPSGDSNHLVSPFTVSLRELAAFKWLLRLEWAHPQNLAFVSQLISNLNYICNKFFLPCNIKITHMRHPVTLTIPWIRNLGVTF